MTSDSRKKMEIRQMVNQPCGLRAHVSYTEIQMHCSVKFYFYGPNYRDYGVNVLKPKWSTVQTKLEVWLLTPDHFFSIQIWETQQLYYLHN